MLGGAAAGSGAGRGRRGGTAARRPAARFISAPLPAGRGGFAFLGPSRLPALPKSLCSGPIVWRGGVRAAAALFGLLQDSWGSYKKQRQVGEQGVPHCPGCPPPPCKGTPWLAAQGHRVPPRRAPPACVLAPLGWAGGAGGLGSPAWQPLGVGGTAGHLQSGCHRSTAPGTRWGGTDPGPRGTKSEAPPHSHPSGGSGRPCHRCHRAPQADIYPCPGAAWQRASSARCYFRSRSLAAAPSPHCSAPRGAAGGSRAPQEPAEPPLATLVLSREAEDAVGIRRSNFPWHREELAGSELLGTSHAAGGLSASLEPALRARLGSPAGDIGCTRPGTDLGAEQGRREPGGLGAHRGSWLLPCPLAPSLGSRN